jgi:galactose-1-phosphate uridylyltransferase
MGVDVEHSHRDVCADDLAPNRAHRELEDRRHAESVG